MKFYFKGVKKAASINKNADIKEYTIKEFSKVVGFASHSYLSLVMQNKRNLSKESLEKVITGLAMNSRASNYFKLLVLYNQETDDTEKLALYKKLNGVKKSTSFHKLEVEQHRYFEHWYYPVIRTLAVHSDWKDDCEFLGNLCYPKITAKQAGKAVADLLDWGLLHKNSKGEFFVTENKIKDKDVPVFIKKKARADVLDNNRNALDDLPINNRYSVYSTWAVGEEKYADIVELFEKYRSEVNDIVSDESSVDKIYTMLFQLIPASKKIPEKK